MQSKATIKANRARNAMVLPKTRWQEGYEYGLNYITCNGDNSAFDRWASHRKDMLQYDSRFTFVWLSRYSFEFNTSNGTICIVTL